MFELSSGWDLWSAKDSFLESSLQSFLGSFFSLLCCLKRLHFLCLERALLIIFSVRVEVMKSLCVSPHFARYLCPSVPSQQQHGALTAGHFPSAKSWPRGCLSKLVSENKMQQRHGAEWHFCLPHSLQRPCQRQLWCVSIDKENSLWKRQELLEKTVAHTEGFWLLFKMRVCLHMNSE